MLPPNFSGWICPLTQYENLFRARAGQAGYRGGFVEHYVVAAIYPDGLTRGTQLAIAAMVVAVNVGIYACVLRMRQKRNTMAI